jgi:hypothetical protein
MKMVDITYKLVYTEDGVRKVKVWEFHGAPTGKKFKEFEIASAGEARSIYMQDNCHMLATSWTGMGKRNK